HFRQRGSIVPAQGLVGEARIATEIGAANGNDEVVPELVGHAHDEDPTVGGREGLYWHDGEMGATRLAARNVLLVEIPDAAVAELMQGDIEQAGIDVAANTGLARANDAAEQAEDAGHPGHVVDH